MCGIGGVFAQDVNSYGNTLSFAIGIAKNVKHRGKDNCGISGLNLNYKTPVLTRIRSSHPIDIVLPSSIPEQYKEINPQLYGYLQNLSGPVNLVHTRFTTKGSYEGITNAQPITYFCTDKKLEALNAGTNGDLFSFDVVPENETWISLAHNGEVNKDIVDRWIEESGYGVDHHNVSSDSGSFAAYILMEAIEKDGVEAALKSVSKNIPGAYALTGLVCVDGDIEAFATRDRYGVRPLWRADQSIDSGQLAYASENSAFNRLGIRNGDVSLVDAGTADIMHYCDDGTLNRNTVQIADPFLRKCTFEVIYNKAPDSRIPFHVRLFDPDYMDVVFGKKNLEKYKKEKPLIVDRMEMFDVATIRERIGELFYYVYGGRAAPHDALCGIPKSGNSYAIGYARASKHHNKEVIIINPEHASERSFMNPTGKMSRAAISKKLLFRPIEECIGVEAIYDGLMGRKKDYRVYSLEDSIVTGTAATESCMRLKMSPQEGGSGANEVHMKVIAPPLCAGCGLGIDVKEDRNIAVNVGNRYSILNPQEFARNELEEFEKMVAKYVGADSVIFSSNQFMEAIFDPEIYGFACVGGAKCAPTE